MWADVLNTTLLHSWEIVLWTEQMGNASMLALPVSERDSGRFNLCALSQCTTGVQPQPEL